MRLLVQGATFALLLSCGCVAGTSGQQSTVTQVLLPIQPSVLNAGEAVALKLSADRNATLELSFGQLPSGLTLDRNGWLRGTPDMPGETQRFTLRATNARGASERSYTLGIGTDQQQVTLAASSLPAQNGDALLFDGVAWSASVSRAFAWDSSLDMIWPLGGGATMSGAGLAPANGTLTLVAGGPQGAGHSQLTMQAADPDVGTVAELSWAEQADINLEVLTSTDSGGGATPWGARSEVTRDAAPGPEVVALNKQAPPGRYALVATKASGDPVSVTLWLTVHERDGNELIQQRFDALFSDTQQGPLWQEINQGRQSYMSLGVIEVTEAGEHRFLPHGDSADPFVVGSP